MKIKLDERKCTGCGICEDICIVGAISVDTVAHIDHESCVLCAACVAECPAQAFSIEGLEERSTRLPEHMDYSGSMEGHGKGGAHRGRNRQVKGRGGLLSWFK